MLISTVSQSSGRLDLKVPLITRFENLVVAVDGSTSPERMAASLMKLPLFSAANVTLLHAVPPQISAEQMKAEWAKGQQILADALKVLALRPGMSVTTELLEGDPKMVVCNYAARKSSPLVIMGSKARSRIAAILQNSVSQYAFQVASCPMVLVKEDCYVKQPSRVMVALKDTPASRRAFDLAVDMVKGIQGGRLYVGRIQPKAMAPTEDPILTEALQELKRANVPYQIITAVGDPGIELCQLADQQGIDFMVMGSPDRRPSVARNLPDLDRLLGKSTSDYVRVHTNCPVLMVRSEFDQE